MKLKQFSLIAILTLSAGAVSSASALTYQDEVELQFTWDPVVNISISGDLVISDLSPGSSSDSNIITITAGSNEANGYTLFGNVGSTTYNYTDLRISPSNSTNKFTNLSTNKATLSNFDENTWGYSYCNATVSSSACDTTSNWVSGSVGSTNAGYNGLPLFNSANTASGVTLADESNASSTTLKFKIGAKASASQAGGTYTNVINFANLAKIVTTSYTLSYVDNSSEATGMPSSSTTGTTTTGAFNITSTIPTRTDYTLKGWCTTNNSSDSTTCSGTLIQPGGIYAIGSSPATFTGSVYAVWQSAVPIITMQEFAAGTASTTCSAMATGDTISLTDSRDGTSYLVAKLADGKCWMTTNLNLAGGTALSADDTDVTSTYISGFTTQGNLTKSGNTIVLPTSSPTGTSVSGYYTDNTMAYVTNSGNNTTTCNSSTPCNSYYSWIAATLGGKQADGSTAQTQNGYNAAASICPKGWRLPTSTTSNANAQTSPNWKTGDWYALATVYGANLESNYYESAATFYNNAGPGTTPNFLLAGYYDNGSFNNGGSYGYYWSSTAYSSTSAYYLYFNSGNVNSANNYARRFGRAVRCVYGE